MLAHRALQPSRLLATSSLLHRVSQTTGLRLASTNSISAAVKHDHRELEEYYNEVVKSQDPDHQVRYGNQFIWELARHSIAEELVVYPAMEKYMGADGKKKADHDREEHHLAKQKLKAFQKLSPKDSDYIPQVKSLMEDLSHHIKKEEEGDLPALEQALANSSEAKESDDLAASFQRTKMFVPTKSHPSAGEKPPFETVMGLLVAPIDRLRDLFWKFPK